MAEWLAWQGLGDGFRHRHNKTETERTTTTTTATIPIITTLCEVSSNRDDTNKKIALFDFLLAGKLSAQRR